jgi:hypothetical protein
MGKPTSEDMVTLKKRWCTVSKLDYAYCAGLFDGEGCVQIVNDKSQGCNSWKLMIQMGMCSKPALDKMVGVFGGHYSEAKRAGFHQNFVYYHWALNGAKAYEALKRLKPFLVEKKEQADIALKFFVYQKNTTYDRKHGLPASVIRKREDFLKRLKFARTASLTPFALAETECENAVMGEATVRT